MPPPRSTAGDLGCGGTSGLCGAEQSSPPPLSLLPGRGHVSEADDLKVREVEAEEACPPFSAAPLAVSAPSFGLVTALPVTSGLLGPVFGRLSSALFLPRAPGPITTAAWLMAASSLQPLGRAAEHPVVVYVFWAHVCIYSSGECDTAEEEVCFS